MRHGGGRASGTVDLVFDANANGLSEASEEVTVDVGASASEVQAALRALGGLLQDVEVSVDASAQRARNGGKSLGGGVVMAVMVGGGAPERHCEPLGRRNNTQEMLAL